MGLVSGGHCQSLLPSSLISYLESTKVVNRYKLTLVKGSLSQSLISSLDYTESPNPQPKSSLLKLFDLNSIRPASTVVKLHERNVVPDEGEVVWITPLVKTYSFFNSLAMILMKLCFYKGETHFDAEADCHLSVFGRSLNHFPPECQSSLTRGKISKNFIFRPE